ncbi:MAG: alginate export family protein [Nitrospiraceae bacterium]|nr:alginate export family protein [Nitrospiraceae bacterium]
MAKKFLVLAVLFFVAVISVPLADADDTFSAGGSLRLRQEIWDNVVDAGTAPTTTPDRNFFRLRTSVWGKAALNKDNNIYLRLTNEAKYYTGPYYINAERNKFEEDELIIDNVYFDAKSIFGLPVDIKVGRQDFLGPDMYGEGFLILDGTPGDGSRSFYFNAARARFRFNQNNSVDFVYISDPMKDVYFPSMRTSIVGSGYTGHKKLLTGSDERGVVLYGRTKPIESISLEPYYIYKEEDTVGTNPLLKLHTVGARAVFEMSGWKLRGEFAHQFGEYNGGNDRTGNGGYVFVGRKYDKAILKPEFDLGFVYLSGDDTSTTNKHEGWDPLFSRAPFWNELMIYTYINETVKDGGPIPGYWTNLEMYMAKLKLNLTADTNVIFSYQYMRAAEKTSGLSASMFSNDGKDRGQLCLAMLNHKFTKSLDGFLQAEYFMPGDFYASNARNAAFIRWQLQYKI